MAYTYQVMPLDETLHHINNPDQESLTPTQIAYDFITPNHSALKERKSLDNESHTGYHLIVDHQAVIERIPLHLKTWTADSNADRQHTIRIKLMDSEKSEETKLNGATLIADLMKRYGIDIHHVFSTQNDSSCFIDLIQKEYQQLINSNPNHLVDLTQFHTFSVGENALLYESIPGFLSSKATVSSTKVEAGTYIIDEVILEARHPIKLLKDGATKGIWVDADKLYKPACGFFPSDPVYVTHPTVAYETAMSSDIISTLPSGYYIVSRIANGSKHPVYLLSDDLTSGVWVGTENLILKVKPPLYQVGEEVTLVKKTPSYKTSNALKQGKLLKAGTYYVYQYKEGEPHPLNLTQTLGQEGLWVNTTTLNHE